MTDDKRTRTDVGFELMAQLSASIGSMADEIRKTRERQERLSQNIWSLNLGAFQFSGTTANIDIPESLGPRTGQVWDLRRISAFGFTGGSVVVRLDDPTNGEAIARFATTGLQFYGKGQAFVRAGRRICLQATGTTGVAGVHIAGLQMSDAVFADYLL